MEKMEHKKIDVLPSTQHGRKLYVGAIRLDELVELWEAGVVSADVYKPGENDDGYQRPLSEGRARRFGKFIGRTKNISPPAVTLYVRDPANGITVRDGKLVIPTKSDATLLYIADGQHRIFGLAYAMKEGLIATNENYLVPFTVTFARDDEKDPRLEEATLFNDINQNAKRVRTDLALQYIMRKREATLGKIDCDDPIPVGLESNSVKAYATRLMHLLAEGEGTWKGKIALANETKATDMPSLAEYVRSITANYLGAGSVLSWAANRRLSLNQLAELLNNYWAAIFELCPEASEGQNAGQYFLKKTIGFHGINGVLPSLMSSNRSLPVVPSKGAFKKVLEEADDIFTDTFWSPTNQNGAGTYGSSARSFKQLAGDIFEVLNKE
jgi:DGQHR domain-containing protein